MNLYLFPAPATEKGGYEICVSFGYKVLMPKQDDIIVWCSNSKHIPHIKPNDYILDIHKLLSVKALTRVLSGRFSTEIDTDDVFFLKGKNFDNIHCDDVIFYRAIRKLYPNQMISLRFHNCFLRIYDRERVLGIRSGWRNEGKLKILKRLERKIFLDNNIYKIFISNEDADYYKMMTGKSDFEVWYQEPDKELMKRNRKGILLSNKIVWFGGVEGHKISSIKWFLNDVYPQLKAQRPNLEFHLFGARTQNFNNTNLSVFGHGFYNQNDIPFRNEALFINPDIIGGGIKIKLLTYFNEGVPFISTPFGFEGYDKQLIDNEYCYVVEEKDWINKILSIFSNYSKT